MAPNPVVSGLLQGFSLANMIHRANVENQALEMQKQRLVMDQQRQDREAQLQEREAQIQDIGIRDRMNAATRPVEGGMVSDNYTTPGLTLPSGAVIDQRSGTISRKADSSRLVRYKTRDGQTIEGELLSPDEQFQRKLGEAKALGDVHTQGQIAAKKGELEATGTPLPPELITALGFDKLPGFDPKQKFHQTSIDNLATAASTIMRSKQPHIQGHGVIPGATDQYIYSIDDKGQIRVAPSEAGARPFAPARPPSDATNLRTKQDAERTQIQKTASLAMVGAKDFEDAKSKLDQLATTSPYAKENYAAVLKAIRSSYGSGKKADDIETVLGQLDAATGKKPPAAAAPAAAPKKPTKGNVNGDQVRAYAKQKGISYQAAEKEFGDFGYTVVR